MSYIHTSTYTYTYSSWTHRHSISKIRHTQDTKRLEQHHIYILSLLLHRHTYNDLKNAHLHFVSHTVIHTTCTCTYFTYLYTTSYIHNTHTIHTHHAHVHRLAPHTHQHTISTQLHTYNEHIYTLACFGSKHTHISTSNTTCICTNVLVHVCMNASMTYVNKRMRILQNKFFLISFFPMLW
jgi:hypothetical protein